MTLTDKRMLFRSYLHRREEEMARQGDLLKSGEAFDYGLDYLPGAARDSDPLTALRRYVHERLAESDAYFEPGLAPDFTLSGNVLTFPSPIETETAVNNQVTCRLFESRRRERAVVMLPHWNSSSGDYAGFARWMSRAGITVLRMSLPYHDSRRPESMRFAHHMVSANLGRTIRSFRQAVLETRLAIGWLRDRGYARIGVIGSSMGSAIGSIVAAKDPHVNALVLLLTASHFGEVVWTGRATRNIRQALEGHISLSELNEVWSIISPVMYVSQLRARDIPVLILSGREDRVFEPRLTRHIVEAYRQQGIRAQWKVLPCGHYTFYTFPSNLFILLAVIWFLRNHL